MKKLKLILSVVLSFFIFLSVANAQKVEEREVDSFRKIRVSQAIEVYLTAGDNEQVRVEADGIPLDRVLTEVSGEVLKIHLDEGNHGHHDVKVYVTYEAIDQISASSASGVYSDDKIKGERLNISVSSAADMELDVEVQQITASVSSSGDLELTGKTEYLNIDVSSAGGVDAFDLEADHVNVEASSAGGAKVTVNKQIDARASSGGSIRYRGNPEKSQTDTSSGGSVRRSE